MADAVYYIVASDSKLNTGNFFIDDELLMSNGIKDFTKYKLFE